MKYIFTSKSISFKKEDTDGSAFCALQILEISFLSILLETGY